MSDIPNVPIRSSGEAVVVTSHGQEAEEWWLIACASYGQWHLDRQELCKGGEFVSTVVYRNFGKGSPAKFNENHVLKPGRYALIGKTNYEEVCRLDFHVQLQKGRQG